MHPVLALYATIFGVFAGFFLAAATVRWVYAVATTVRSRHVGGSEHRTRPLMWALPMVLLLHSTPWLLALAGYLLYQLLSQARAPEWQWFFGGLSVSPVLLVASVFHARWRHSHATTKPQNVDHAA